MRPLLLVGVLAAMTAVTAAAAGSSRPTIALDCLGKPTLRPAEVVLACADAGLGIRGLRWLGWGEPTAVGLGIAFANDCTPTCASGRFHTYRGILLLGGTQRCHGKVAYRSATIAVVGEPPVAWRTSADATYPLRCAA